MKKEMKQLIVLYFVIVLLKISLAYFIAAPSAFSDDYGNAKLARSFFYEHTLTVHSLLTTRPPLYAIALSPAYIFKDMELVFFFMKVLNALMSSLIIIPAWLMSKEFFDKKEAMLLTLVIAVLPAHFSFTYFLMSENLFYPLFFFSIYSIYKSFTEENFKWDVLAGVFIGFTYLTKITALILPAMVFCIFVFKLLKKDYKEVSKKVIMAFSFLVTVSPWLIRNWLILGSGFDKHLVLGTYSETLDASIGSVGGNFLPTFLTGFIIYLGYLMISSGFIFFIYSLLALHKPGNKNVFIFSLLTLLSILFMVCLASRTFKFGVIEYPTIFPWLGGKLIGRYVEVVMPLIIINGWIGIKLFKKIPKYYIILITVLLIFSSQLIFFSLFPINNMSLAWSGVLKFLSDFLIYKKITFITIFSPWYTVLFIMIFAILLLFMFYLKSKISVRNLLLVFILFFSLVSLLNFVITYYNSYTFWYKGEQTQLGLWFNKYDPEISTVLFDERDGCKIFKTNQTCIYNPFRTGGAATVIGFWMNDEIKIGPINNLKGIDYVVSRHKLDLQLLKETKNGIFLYKVGRTEG